MVASVIRPRLSRRTASCSLKAASAPTPAAPTTDTTAATSKPPALRTISFAVTKSHASTPRQPTTEA